jgi:hypothetical protein
MEITSCRTRKKHRIDVRPKAMQSVATMPPRARTPRPCSRPTSAAAEKGADLVERGIRQWKRERPDIDSSGKAVVGRLLRLEEVVLRTLNQVLEPFGHEVPGVRGARHPARGRRAVQAVAVAPAEHAAVHVGWLSNLLKRLEKEGWVKRSIDPNDGRGVLVKLTAKGVRLADEAMPRHAAAELHLLRMFDASQREVLSGLLGQMMTGNAPELGPAEI